MNKININSPLTKSIKIYNIIIDTNILFYVFYSRIEKNSSNKEKLYQDFITFLISTNVKIHTTQFNIYELFHLIDKINLELYNKANSKTLTIKDYHKIPSERTKVHDEFKVVYNSIKQSINILPSTLSDLAIADYINNNSLTLDFYDFALFFIASENDIKNILTHDSDFLSLESADITIFTQNHTILNSL